MSTEGLSPTASRSQLDYCQVSFFFYEFHNYLFFNLFIPMCIHSLSHYSPLPPTLPPTASLSPQPPLHPDRTCSAFISNLVEE
jgi:hypothetical protein